METTTGFQRRLAAIMFTDVAGYSKLVQKNETHALQLLRQHFQMVRGVIPRFNGNEIKTIGDSFLIEFPSAVQAADCAIAIQEDIQRINKTLATDTLSRADEIHIRIGIHLGDIVIAESDVFGDGVNIASRIEPHAPVDGICLSEDMARQVSNKIKYPLIEIGATRLKNIQDEVVLYSVQLPWLSTADLPGEPAAAATAAARKEAGRRRNKWIVLAIAALVLVTAGAGFFVFRPRQQNEKAASQVTPAPTVSAPAQPAVQDPRAAARAALKEKRFGDVLTLLQSSPSIPADAEVEYMRGQANIGLGKIESAIASFARAVQAQRNNVSYRVALSSAYESHSQYDKAIEHLDAAIKLPVDSAYPIVKLNEMHSRLTEAMERTVSFPIVTRARHLHRLPGTGCWGELTIRESGVSFKPEKGNDEMSAERSGISAMTLERETLKLDAKGKHYTYRLQNPAPVAKYLAAEKAKKTL